MQFKQRKSTQNGATRQRLILFCCLAAGLLAGCLGDCFNDVFVPESRLLTSYQKIGIAAFSLLTLFKLPPRINSMPGPYSTAESSELSNSMKNLLEARILGR